MAVERGDMRSQMAAISERIAAGASEPPPAPKDEGMPTDREVTPAGEKDPQHDAVLEQAAGESPHDEQSAAEIRTLQQLADAIEADPEFIYGLEMGMPDGQPPLKLGELKDRLQEYERRSGEVERMQHELEQQRQQAIAWASQLGQQQERVSAEVAEAQYEMRAAEEAYDRIDWDELRKLDPGRAALEQQTLMARYGAAKERAQQAQQQAQQLQYQTHAQAKAYHDQQLLARVPAWKDPQVAKTEVEGIVGWARNTYGFSDPELQTAVDWRHRDILRKAWKYDQLQEKAKENAGKPPVPLSAGRTLKIGQAQKQRIKELTERARKTGTRADKVAAAKAVLDNTFRNG
jgi:hypothetical protein